jgi:8-oxo-dGTP pyrophosphatase MutT (NUDIX family)
MHEHGEDELLDLVDDQDQVIGQGWRSVIVREGRSNVRVVNAFLERPDSRLWIPRRSPHKRLFPNCLDMSMGGYVSAGETYEVALARELWEELRLNLADLDWSLLGHFTPHAHGVSAFMHVYRIQTDRAPDYNVNDFVEAYWLTPSDVLERIRQGDCAKDDLPRLIASCYGGGVPVATPD